jgi:hypothetical protein
MEAQAFRRLRWPRYPKLSTGVLSVRIKSRSILHLQPVDLFEGGAHQLNMLDTRNLAVSWEMPSL